MNLNGKQLKLVIIVTGGLCWYSDPHIRTLSDRSTMEGNSGEGDGRGGGNNNRRRESASGQESSASTDTSGDIIWMEEEDREAARRAQEAERRRKREIDEEKDKGKQRMTVQEEEEEEEKKKRRREGGPSAPRRASGFDERWQQSSTAFTRPPIGGYTRNDEEEMMETSKGGEEGERSRTMLDFEQAARIAKYTTGLDHVSPIKPTKSPLDTMEWGRRIRGPTPGYSPLGSDNDEQSPWSHGRRRHGDLSKSMDSPTPLFHSKMDEEEMELGLERGRHQQRGPSLSPFENPRPNLFTPSPQRQADVRESTTLSSPTPLFHSKMDEEEGRQVTVSPFENPSPNPFTPSPQRQEGDTFLSRGTGPRMSSSSSSGRSIEGPETVSFSSNRRYAVNRKASTQGPSGMEQSFNEIPENMRNERLEAGLYVVSHDDIMSRMNGPYRILDLDLMLNIYIEYGEIVPYLKDYNSCVFMEEETELNREHVIGRSDIKIFQNYTNDTDLIEAMFRSLGLMKPKEASLVFGEGLFNYYVDAASEFLKTFVSRIDKGLHEMIKVIKEGFIKTIKTGFIAAVMGEASRGDFNYYNQVNMWSFFRRFKHLMREATGIVFKLMNEKSEFRPMLSEMAEISYAMITKVHEYIEREVGRSSASSSSSSSRGGEVDKDQQPDINRLRRNFLTVYMLNDDYHTPNSFVPDLFGRGIGGHRNRMGEEEMEGADQQKKLRYLQDLMACTYYHLWIGKLYNLSDSELVGGQNEIVPALRFDITRNGLDIYEGLLNETRQAAVRHAISVIRNLPSALPEQMITRNITWTRSSLMFSGCDVVRASIVNKCLEMVEDYYSSWRTAAGFEGSPQTNPVSWAGLPQLMGFIKHAMKDSINVHVATDSEDELRLGVYSIDVNNPSTTTTTTEGKPLSSWHHHGRQSSSGQEDDAARRRPVLLIDFSGSELFDRVVGAIVKLAEKVVNSIINVSKVYHEARGSTGPSILQIINAIMIERLQHTPKMEIRGRILGHDGVDFGLKSHTHEINIGLIRYRVLLLMIDHFKLMMDSQYRRTNVPLGYMGDDNSRIPFMVNRIANPVPVSHGNYSVAVFESRDATIFESQKKSIDYHLMSYFGDSRWDEMVNSEALSISAIAYHLAHYSNLLASFYIHLDDQMSFRNIMSIDDLKSSVELINTVSIDDGRGTGTSVTATLEYNSSYLILIDVSVIHMIWSRVFDRFRSSVTDSVRTYVSLIRKANAHAVSKALERGERPIIPQFPPSLMSEDESAQPKLFHGRQISILDFIFSFDIERQSAEGHTDQAPYMYQSLFMFNNRYQYEVNPEERAPIDTLAWNIITTLWSHGPAFSVLHALCRSYHQRFIMQPHANFFDIVEWLINFRRISTFYLQNDHSFNIHLGKLDLDMGSMLNIGVNSTDIYHMKEILVQIITYLKNIVFDAIYESEINR